MRSLGLRAWPSWARPTTGAHHRWLQPHHYRYSQGCCGSGRQRSETASLVWGKLWLLSAGPAAQPSTRTLHARQRAPAAQSPARRPGSCLQSLVSALPGRPAPRPSVRGRVWCAGPGPGPSWPRQPRSRPGPTSRHSSVVQCLVNLTFGWWGPGHRPAAPLSPPECTTRLPSLQSPSCPTGPAPTPGCC